MLLAPTAVMKVIERGNPPTTHARMSDRTAGATTPVSAAATAVLNSSESFVNRSRRVEIHLPSRRRRETDLPVSDRATPAATADGDA
jgi:hypothetical protein